MNKVLYISYDGMTDPLGQSQVIPYLVGLAKEGFEITLLSCEKKLPYLKFKGDIGELLKNAEIKWEPIRYSKSPPIISTIYDLYKIRKKAYSLHQKETFKIIHCRSYISAFVGLWMKKKFGAKFLFDMRGFWADERVEGGIWNLKNPIFKYVYAFFKQQENKFLSQADHIVSLTHKGKEIILSWQYIHNQPLTISVIPCCVDTDHFDAEKINLKEKEEIKNKLGINPEDKIMTYLGSLGTWYLIDEMLIFYKKILEDYPEYKFLFITKDDHSIVEERANQLRIPKENLIFTSSERKQLPTLLSVSNLAISFIKPSFSKSASSPTKLGELLCMGIPVICNTGVGDVGFYLQEDLSVLLNSDSEKFSELEILNIEKKKFKDLVNKSFSLEIGIKKYIQVYKKLI